MLLLERFLSWHFFFHEGSTGIFMKYVTLPNLIPRSFIVRSPDVSGTLVSNIDAAIDEDSYRVTQSEGLTIELLEATVDVLQQSQVIDSGHQRLAGLHWYPSSRYILPHVEFSLGDDVYDGFLHYVKRKESYAEVMEQARNNGYGFFEFTMNLPETDFEFIAESIRGKSGFQSCISSACKAFNLSKSIYIPPFVRWSTLMTGLYLGMGAWVRPKGDCRHVSYFGNFSAKNYNPLGLGLELNMFLTAACILQEFWNLCVSP